MIYLLSLPGYFWVNSILIFFAKSINPFIGLLCFSSKLFTFRFLFGFLGNDDPVWFSWFSSWFIDCPYDEMINVITSIDEIEKSRGSMMALRNTTTSLSFLRFKTQSINSVTLKLSTSLYVCNWTSGRNKFNITREKNFLYMIMFVRFVLSTIFILKIKCLDQPTVPLYLQIRVRLNPNLNRNLPNSEKQLLSQRRKYIF